MPTISTNELAAWSGAGGTGPRNTERPRPYYHPATFCSSHLVVDTSFLLVKMENCSNHRLITESLNRLREKLATDLVTLDENGAARKVFDSARQWIGTRSICSQNLLQAIDIAERATEVLFRNHGFNTVAVNKACLGMYVAECVARRLLGTSTSVTGHWEDVVWAFVALLWKWEIRCINDMLPQSSTLKHWVIRVFNDPQICPNFHLRLEMLHLIGQCTNDDIWNPVFGMLITSGVVTTSVYLTLDHLMPEDSRRSLTTALIRVLEGIRRYGYLSLVSVGAILWIENLQVGPEAHCLAHLVELVGQLAMRAQEKYVMGLWSVSMTLKTFDSTFILLQLLLTTIPMNEAYECPGLAQMAAATLVTATSSVLTVAPTLRDDEATRCSWIISIIDDIFRILALYEKPQSLIAVLRRDHSQTLAELSRRAADLQCPLYHLPQGDDESTEGCPEKFMDSVTQAVMEAPVLLTSSKMVVDESTLMHLLLVSPRDPFTRHPLDQGSYTRLPDLRADIDAWRSRVNPDQTQSHDDSSSDDNNSSSGESTTDSNIQVINSGSVE